MTLKSWGKKDEVDSDEEEFGEDETNFHVIMLSSSLFQITKNHRKVFDYEIFLFINRSWYAYLFSGTHILGWERPKLRTNQTVIEVDQDRDRDRIKSWTEWRAKDQTVTGTTQP